MTRACEVKLSCDGCVRDRCARGSFSGIQAVKGGLDSSSHPRSFYIFYFFVLVAVCYMFSMWFYQMSPVTLSNDRQ